MLTILITRFNNETWIENSENRIKRNIPCIYNSPIVISETISLNSKIFVIEMNNSTNKILGIGFIKNKMEIDKYYKIHKDANYNRFTYIGNFHIDRDTLMTYNSKLVNVLEEILFKGYTHTKRGCGFTKISKKVLQFEICKHMNLKKEIKEIFLSHFTSDSLNLKTNLKSQNK